MARKHHTPAYLHALARIQFGTTEADNARHLGGMFYADLLEQTKDFDSGRALLWRPNKTQEASNDTPATPPVAPADPQGTPRD